MASVPYMSSIANGAAATGFGVVRKKKLRFVDGSPPPFGSYVVSSVLLSTSTFEPSSFCS